MTFGAVIAVKSGPFDLPLDPDIDGALAEVRVEQHLDEPTAFALRFQEDFEGDQPKLTEHPLFKTSTELVILVADGPDAKGLVCLVRGIVEQDQCYDTPPIDAVRISYENLRKLGAA